MQAGRLGRVFGALNTREKLWICYNGDMYNNIFFHPQNNFSFNKISLQTVHGIHTTWEVGTRPVHPDLVPDLKYLHHQANKT
jgi:hypothetical protein